MSLYNQQSKNIFKTNLLFLLFFIFIIAIGWFFRHLYNNPIILYFAVILSVVMSITSYWFSDKIVLGLAGAHKAERKKYFDLYTTVENLSITAGLPMPKVYVIEDPAPNAFATGRDKDHAVVAVTTGLLEILNKSELEGVIAHELSHIGNKDILISTVIVVLVGFVSILADMFLRNIFWSHGHRDNKNGIIIGIGIVLAILSPIFATLIQLAISRKREFLADASGALLTRYPEGLANALKKISQYARPMNSQASAIAHLYISDPDPADHKMKFSEKIMHIFATHPPVQERISALLGK